MGTNEPLFGGTAAEADRLRQIIFGPQMEAYERRFADQRRELDRMLNDLRQINDTVSDFEKSQTQRVETLEHDMQRSNRELGEKIEHCQSQLPLPQQVLARARQLEEVTQEFKGDLERISHSFSRQEQELKALKRTLYESREQLERKLEATKREMRQTDDQLRDDLWQSVDRLGDQKTDRKALASMLIEIATRLRTGSNVSGLLESLGTSQ
ncbi:MAG TPA: hypothetical protein G4N98_10240 [Thermoflexia bacterium]|nr:hypothetical protein [Thermoflexia bacterium]